MVIFGPDMIVRCVTMWDGSVPLALAEDETAVAYDGDVSVGWTWAGDYALHPTMGKIAGYCTNAPFVYGKLKGTVYDFAEPGHILPLHTHTDADVHISIVSRGSFLCHGDRGDMTISAGDVIDWEPGEQHGFRALEANSRLVNIIKGISP